MAVLKENGSGNISGIDGSIVIEYESEEMAKAVFESINVDNYQYVHCSLEGRRIICSSSSFRASQLLHTLDDLLSCIIVAEGVYRKT